MKVAHEIQDRLSRSLAPRWRHITYCNVPFTAAGSARADFPGGDAHQLYRSMHRLPALPPETTMYVCHDYPPAARGPSSQTTVAEQRAHNIHAEDGISPDECMALRHARDAALEVPTLILPSIEVNERAGELPQPDANSVACLRIPLNSLQLGLERTGG